MTSEDVVAQAIHDAWQPVDQAEQFPSRHTQARAVLAALDLAGFAVVLRPPGLAPLVERLRSRNRGRPSWTEDHDPLAEQAATILSIMVQESRD